MPKKKRHKKLKFKFPKGFTLIEILVAIAIVGILSSIGIFAFYNARIKGKDTNRKADFESLRNALRLYYNDYQHYPAADVNGKILGCGETGVDPCDWGDEFSAKGIVYMKELPQDPTNEDQHFYTYTQAAEGESFVLQTYLEGENDQDDYKSQSKCGLAEASQQDNAYIICDPNVQVVALERDITTVVTGDGTLFTPNVCGNGEVEPANDEECDDGNLVNDDGCDNLCHAEYICGDQDSETVVSIYEICEGQEYKAPNQQYWCWSDVELPLDTTDFENQVSAAINYCAGCPAWHCARTLARYYLGEILVGQAPWVLNGDTGFVNIGNYDPDQELSVRIWMAATGGCAGDPAFLSSWQGIFTVKLTEICE